VNLKFRIILCVLFAALAVPALPGQSSDMVQTGSDIPSKWQKPESDYDYVKRDEPRVG